MLYFLVRGTEQKSYELRLNPEQEGFQLVVRDEGGGEVVELFDCLEAALSRERQLLEEWRTLGWAELLRR